MESYDASLVGGEPAPRSRRSTSRGARPPRGGCAPRPGVREIARKRDDASARRREGRCPHDGQGNRLAASIMAAHGCRGRGGWRRRATRQVVGALRLPLRLRVCVGGTRPPASSSPLSREIGAPSRRTRGFSWSRRRSREWSRARARVRAGMSRSPASEGTVQRGDRHPRRRTGALFPEPMDGCARSRGLRR